MVDVGAAVTQFTAGDRIYGLSGAGGYAQLATIHESLAMPMELNFQQAESIPEVFFTASTALRTLGNLQEGERALIHAGGSGVGIAAIQIFGTVMRSRPLADRAAITRDYSDMLEPGIVAGKNQASHRQGLPAA